jgi:putative colanic acid biosynthesis acetyltransferase WcaF
VYGSTNVWFPPNLEMGEFSVLGWNVNCYNQGDFAIVSQYSHLVSGTHDVDDPNFQLLVKPISIGNHAWIASDAFVGPGVTIHEGAVLGARGVTFKDLLPWTIYIGNPCNIVRDRQRHDTCVSTKP